MPSLNDGGRVAAPDYSCTPKDGAIGEQRPPDYLDEIDLVLLGSGGHARVLLDILTISHATWRLAILTPDFRNLGTLGGQVLVLGDDDLLPSLAAKSPSAGFVVGVGSVAPGPLRQRLFENARRVGLRPVTVIHPSAVISPSVCVDAGAQLLPATVVNAGARVRANAIVNTAAVVEHDCDVGEHAHVSPGALLCGGVMVGQGAHVGAGAVVRQGIRIGVGAQIGAGAVVVSEVPAGTTVVGVPARPLERFGRAGT